MKASQTEHNQRFSKARGDTFVHTVRKHSELTAVTRENVVSVHGACGFQGQKQNKFNKSSRKAGLFFFPRRLIFTQTQKVRRWVRRKDLAWDKQRVPWGTAAPVVVKQLQVLPQHGAPPHPAWEHVERWDMRWCKWAHLCVCGWNIMMPVCETGREEERERERVYGGSVTYIWQSSSYEHETA